MTEKLIVWVGSALEDLRGFPPDARRRAGLELLTVQRGGVPSSWKPMPSVGAGVIEIRISTGQEHRVLYVSKFEEAIYVLHAFEKKTQKTSRHGIQLGANRLADVLLHRMRTSRKTGGDRNE